MNQNIALIVAGCIFGLIALLHLLRLIYKTDITFATRQVPFSVSYIGFIISLALSIWMFSAS